jgi:hypothetical protein
MFSILRKMASPRARQPRGYAQKGNGFRPRLEALEDRLLLSTFTVVDLGDGGIGAGLQGDLRYCIASANANADLSNRIVFQPGLTGTVLLTQGGLTITKSLEIDGPGSGELTVSGNHQNGVFNVTAPAGDTVILADLTIADGTGFQVSGQLGTAGGGLKIDAAAVTLNRCIVSGNSVSQYGFGGGIYNSGTLILNDSTVADNNGYSGILSSRGPLTVNRSTFEDNNLFIGGAAIESSGPAAINDSTFEDNTFLAIINGGNMTITASTIDDNYGGGINNTPSGSLTLTASRVERNAGYYGGGIENHGAFTIVDSVIAHNTARGNAGGIGNFDGRMTVTGSTIADNTADLFGGGISNIAQLVLENTTISGNHATVAGGIGDNDPDPRFRPASFLEITSCTITANTASGSFGGEEGGGGLYAGGLARPALIRNTLIAGNHTDTVGPDIHGTVTSLGYDLVGDPSDSTGWSGSDLRGTAESPLDPQLGPLQDNGGPTPTQALLAGSPALRAGDPLLRFSSDQRGSGRTSAPLQAEVDIGAFNAGDASQFLLAAPATAGVGEPITVTLTALDRWGNRASTYTGTVHFSSTDLNAMLPDDSGLAADDAGSGTFTVVLNTPGDQRIRANDVDKPSIRGDADVLVASPSGLTVVAGLLDALAIRKHEPGDQVAYA